MEITLSKPTLKNKIFTIIDAGTVDELLNLYEMMMNTPSDFIIIDLMRVRRFVNKIYDIKNYFSKDQEKYKTAMNEDPYLVGILRGMLHDLYSNSNMRSFKYSYTETSINDKGKKND